MKRSLEKGNYPKEGDTNKEDQKLSDKLDCPAASNKEEDLSQRAGEEFDRSNIYPETVPSSYEIEVHTSVNSLPSEMCELFSQINKDILKENEYYRDYQLEHINKSEEAILDSAKIALGRVPEGQSKKALLLGVGNALDIPLQELVEKFDRLTIVELDRESTENAIKQLSPSLQAKIKLVEGQRITGF